MLRPVALVAALVLPCGAARAEPLDARIESLAAAHKGKVTVALKHLGTGETYYRHPDDVMPTASLIKLPVMAEVYAQSAAGKVNLGDMLTLTKEEMVQGSG